MQELPPILIVYKTPAQADAIWSSRFPPNVQRTFDIEIHAHSFQVGADCSEETVWAASIVDKPLRLCTVWIKRLPSGQVIQGKDVFWSIPKGSFATNGPYLWPRGYGLKSSFCFALTKRLKIAIPRAPKNYPVWPPIPDPAHSALIFEMLT